MPEQEKNLYNLDQVETESEKVREKAEEIAGGKDVGKEDYKEKRGIKKKKELLAPSSFADAKGGMIGEKMGKVYDNYFESPEILKYSSYAVDEISDQLENIKQPIKMFEIGANAGIVSENISQHLKNKGIDNNSFISDINIQGLKDNENSEIIKIVIDNKRIPCRDDSIDLIIARSVTHYENTPEKEKKVLEEVERILKKDCFFINQIPTASTNEEAKLWRNIHLLVNKPMNIQTQETTTKMLKEIFNDVNLAFNQPPSLSATETGFVKRYNIKDDDAKEMIKKIQDMIHEIEEDKRPNIRVADSGFEWDVPFTIFICKK